MFLLKNVVIICEIRNKVVTLRSNLYCSMCTYAD